MARRGKFAEQGKDFTIISEPDEPIVVVVPTERERGFEGRIKLPRVLAELREQFPGKHWQVVPSKLRKVDTGSGMALHEVVEYLVISFDPL